MTVSKAMPGSLKDKKIRKNKGKKVVKNVLTLRPDTFWPLISDDDGMKIKAVLEKELSVVNCWKPQVPWYILMKMTKEQRKDKIKEETESLPSDKKACIELAKSIRKELAFGVNECVKMMERKKISFCLIDSSDELKILVDKLLALARKNQILVALIPNMKELMKPIIGFSTLVLGFKSSIEENSSPIKNCLEIMDLIKKLNVLPSNNSSNICLPVTSVSKPKIVQERLSDLYLFRSSNTERVFRPDPIEVLPESDYITVATTVSKEEQVNKKTFRRYTDQDSPANTPGKVFDSPLVLVTQSNVNKKRKR